MNLISKQSSGLRGIKTIREFDIKDKTVFLRLDLNVPLEHDAKTGDARVTDLTRVKAALPTIVYGLNQGAKLVIASHLGRPKVGDLKKGDRKYSMEPVGLVLAELIAAATDGKDAGKGHGQVTLVEDPTPDSVKHHLQNLRKNQVILLENVRFEEGETENASGLAESWAQMCDIYINDAFGASHRAHASIEALAKMKPERGVGFLIEKEIQFLDKLIDQPKKPYVAVLGGAKVSDKIDVIEKLMNVVDGFVIGGAMAYTFLKASGTNVGKSLVEADKVSYAKEMMERMNVRGKSLLLPVDHLITDKFDATGTQKTTSSATIEEGFMGVDIGPKTIQNYAKALQSAKTIFWNGPMGIFENPDFSKGTFAIAAAIAENGAALKVVGGGDSAAAAEQSGFAEKMTHISTGGGASLEYLQGDRLPGLEALRYKGTY